MTRTEIAETAALLRRVAALVEAGEMEAPRALLARLEAAAVALEEAARPSRSSPS